uniref:Uncharacterized protein n=1 Tax=Micrurus lemniscatus lemniscatus TaxID=129467 RepID=A0A2D4I220_MICLE
MANERDGKGRALDKSKKKGPSKAAEKEAHRCQRALEKQIDKNTRQAAASSQRPSPRPSSPHGSFWSILAITSDPGHPARLGCLQQVPRLEGLLKLPLRPLLQVSDRRKFFHRKFLRPCELGWS